MSFFDRAEAARKSLFERYDNLNSQWTKAERRLTRCHIPREVFYKYAEDTCPDTEYGTTFWLGLVKIKGRWRIAHGSCPVSSERHPDDWIPIIESSAEDRVDAAAHFDDFFSKVIEDAESFVRDVDIAIASLAKANGEVDEKVGADPVELCSQSA